MIRIVGMGSPHGDDQAGWLVAERLAREPGLPADVLMLANPLELLDHLEDCTHLIVVDAAGGTGVSRAVTRLAWPDARITRRDGGSTHGLGVAYALQMAENMRRLPAEVIVYAIRAAVADTSSAPAGDCLAAVAQAAESIVAEVHALTRHDPCTSGH